MDTTVKSDLEQRNDDPQLALHLDQLGKSYGEIRALNPIDLKVEQGEFMTLLGPSGCGKTTVLNLIAGFISPTEGRVFIGGNDVSRKKPRDRGVGMVFQSYALFPHLTVAENIAYGLKMRGWSRTRRRERVRELLATIGLSGYEDRKPDRLSGGQQQRVAVARALAWNPTILLMDEPLSALDRELRVMMAEQLREIHDELNATSVLVTHDREEAMRLATKVAVLRDGRVECVSTPERIYEDPPTPFAASFFGTHNLLEVELVSWDDQARQATVVLANTRMTFPLANPGETTNAVAVAASPGKEVTLSLPRDAIDVGAAGDVRAQVKHVTYLGDVVQVTVELDGRTLYAEVPASKYEGIPAEACLIIDAKRGRVHGAISSEDGLGAPQPQEVGDAL